MICSPERSHLILASSSKPRAALLSNAGYCFSIRPSGVVEDIPEGLGSFSAIAIALASLKAETVAQQYSKHIVLGADQIAIYRDEVWGKPKDEAEAVHRLEIVRGDSITYITGISLFCDGKNDTFSCSTTVHFSSTYDKNSVERYVGTHQGMACAGGIGFEGYGGYFVREINGDWFNLLGLPIPSLISRLSMLEIFPNWCSSEG